MKKNILISVTASAITMVITITFLSNYYLMEQSRGHYKTMLQSYDGMFAVATMNCDNVDNEFLISKVQQYQTTLDKYENDYNNIEYTDYLYKQPLKEEVLKDVKKRKQEISETDFANIIANKDYTTACTNVSKMVANK